MSAPRRVLVFGLTAALVLAVTLSCSSPTGPSGASCDGAFTYLPVPASAIAAATPIGSMGPPTHTIPTDHVGIYLNGTGITLVAPSAFHVTEVRTTRYLTSTFRAGQSDFSLVGTVCRDTQMILGHIQTVVGSVQSQTGDDCEMYSTATETVRSCVNDDVDLTFAAGETIGTVGGVSAGAFDLGLYRDGHQNVFVNPSRYSGLTLSAICPYDPFTSDLRRVIDDRIGFPGRRASGEAPLCGTMNVDVAGTAQGVWVMQSDPVNQQGDESPFLALAPHPFYPQSGLTFSAGPPALASSENTLPRFPLATTGRVNRSFRDVTGDGLIYCYTSEETPSSSYFVRLTSSTLTVQALAHARGASVCATDPSTWAMDGRAIAFIR